MALVSFSEMTRGLFHVVTCNDPDVRAIMELTQDRVTDVVAGFRGENSNTLTTDSRPLSAHSSIICPIKDAVVVGMDLTPLKSERSRNPGWMSARSD